MYATITFKYDKYIVILLELSRRDPEIGLRACIRFLPLLRQLENKNKIYDFKIKLRQYFEHYSNKIREFILQIQCMFSSSTHNKTARKYMYFDPSLNQI